MATHQAPTAQSRAAGVRLPYVQIKLVPVTRLLESEAWNRNRSACPACDADLLKSSYSTGEKGRESSKDTAIFNIPKPRRLGIEHATEHEMPAVCGPKRQRNRKLPCCDSLCQASASRIGPRSSSVVWRTLRASSA